MICRKCGKAIPDGSIVCDKCGTELISKDENQTVIYASQKENHDESNVKQSKKAIKWIIIGIAVCASIALILFIKSEVDKAKLKKDIMKEWSRVEDSITKILDVRDNEIEYKAETRYSWLNTSFATYEWKVVSGDKIKIKRFHDEYEIFTIVFNDEKDILTISPAITSSDSREIWFYFD